MMPGAKKPKPGFFCGFFYHRDHREVRGLRINALFFCRRSLGSVHSVVYHARLEIVNLDRAKAPGFSHRKSVHISNINRLTMTKPRELSHGTKSPFQAARGINKKIRQPSEHFMQIAAIAGLCDHTFLLPTEAFRTPGISAIHARRHALDAFLSETALLHPYAVCVPACDVALTRTALPALTIAATVGFPDGPRYSTAYKIVEAEQALANGATEIDMVLNYDALKGGDTKAVEADIKAVVKVGGVLKVILEISELSLEQTRLACQIASHCGVAFVKTSTGFSAHGATTEHLKVMRENFPKGIKISGGVTLTNLDGLLIAATTPGQPISIDPMQLRIGESSLLKTERS